MATTTDIQAAQIQQPAIVSTRCQHVAYIPAEGPQQGHVRELVAPLGSDDWAVNDLTRCAENAPLAATGPGFSPLLTAWVDPGDMHVAYVSADRHVIELWHPLDTGHWQWKDLTATTRAPLAATRGQAPGSPAFYGGLTSFSDAVSKHVVYVDDQRRLQDLGCLLGPHDWTVQPLTGPGASLPRWGSTLTSFTDSVNAHVVYVSDDPGTGRPDSGHVQEIYRPLAGGTWQANDLTKNTPGAPLASTAAGTTSWATGGYKHVAFCDSVNHIWELSGEVENTWSAADLTRAAQAPSAAASTWGNLTSWTDSDYQHVVYVSSGGDVDGHVQELYWPFFARPQDRNWRHSDLSKDPAVPPASTTQPGVTSWVTAGVKHVAFVPRPPDPVQELSCPLDGDGTWHRTPLTGATPAGSMLVSWADTPPFTIEQLREIITACGPVIRFHPDEKYNMCPVSEFTRQATLHWAGGSLPSPGPDRLPMPPRDGDKYWLTIPDTDQGGDLPQAKAYVHASWSPGLDHTDLQFWLFYSYNGPGTLQLNLGALGLTVPTDPLGEHYGDWECCMIRIDNATRRPVAAWLSQHESGTFYAESQLSKFHWSGQQIVAYSSRNGHAGYPGAGDYPTHNYSAFIPPVGRVGGYLRNDTADGGKSLNCAASSEIIATDWLGALVPEPRWLLYPYRWGPKKDLTTAEVEEILKENLRKTSVPAAIVSTLAWAIAEAIKVNSADLSGPEGPRYKYEDWRRQYET